jgi:hypothetical protein
MQRKTKTENTQYSVRVQCACEVQGHGFLISILSTKQYFRLCEPVKI